MQHSSDSSKRTGNNAFSPGELLALLMHFHFTALKLIQLLPDGCLHREGNFFGKERAQIAAATPVFAVH